MRAMAVSFALLLAACGGEVNQLVAPDGGGSRWPESQQPAMGPDWEESFELGLDAAWRRESPRVGCVIEPQLLPTRLSPNGGQNLLLYRPRSTPPVIGDCSLSRAISPAVTRGKVSLWFFDDADPIGDTGKDMGVALKASDDRKLWVAIRHTGFADPGRYSVWAGDHEEASQVRRSFGWHLLEFTLDDGAASIAIDSKLVRSGIALRDFSTVKLFSGWNGSGGVRFDGLVVQSVARHFSGIYPHLALIGDERNTLRRPDGSEICNEVGIGALVSWQGKLWGITYPPHSWAPAGLASFKPSVDLLFTVDPATLRISRVWADRDGATFWPDGDWMQSRVGGTHAGRLIHHETQSLVLGPYVIDASQRVRVIDRATIPGRLTAVARHFDTKKAASHVLLYTMEQGLYEVELASLAVKALHLDQNALSIANMNNIPNCLIAGAHGKAAYSGQGRLILANNGLPPSYPNDGCSENPDHGKTGYRGGALADSLDGHAFTLQSAEKFTEVTGPDGIEPRASSSAVWAIGWDHRSALLKVLDAAGGWATYRFPKASNSADADHGWATEWPRIHRLGDRSVADLSGGFFSIPTALSTSNAAGVRPLARHLSVVNEIVPLDRGPWAGGLAMARNDAGYTPAPGEPVSRPQSNLQFFRAAAPHHPADLTAMGLGLPAGDGGPWLEDLVSSGATPLTVVSDPYFFKGYPLRAVHLASDGNGPVTFTVEVSDEGKTWSPYGCGSSSSTCGFVKSTISLGPTGYCAFTVPTACASGWIRFRASVGAAVDTHLTAFLSYETPPAQASGGPFGALAPAGAATARVDGALVPRGETLDFWLRPSDGSPAARYRVDGNLKIAPSLPSDGASQPTEAPLWSIPDPSTGEGDAPLVVAEGRRLRLPRSPCSDYDRPSTAPRARRYLLADRILANIHGTFYDFPALSVSQAINARTGGWKTIRPIATHNRLISDFAVWRGLLALSGVRRASSTQVCSATDEHCVESSDGRVGLWLGSLEDLWRLGAPAGIAQVWGRKRVLQAGHDGWSDPLLMHGYAYKRLDLSVGAGPAGTTVEIWVDVAGNDHWRRFRSRQVGPGATVTERFPEGYGARWVRLRALGPAEVTATFRFGPSPL